VSVALVMPFYAFFLRYSVHSIVLFKENDIYLWYSSCAAMSIATNNVQVTNKIIRLKIATN